MLLMRGTSQSQCHSACAQGAPRDLDLSTASVPECGMLTERGRELKALLSWHVFQGNFEKTQKVACSAWHFVRITTQSLFLNPRFCRVSISEHLPLCEDNKRREENKKETKRIPYFPNCFDTMLKKYIQDLKSCNLPFKYTIAVKNETEFN